MVGSIEPFIRGLYNVAPKCEICGDIAQFIIIYDDGTERYLCSKHYTSDEEIKEPENDSKGLD